MSKRPPNELESRLHQAALASAKKEITAKQAEAIIPDATARQNALNFLLGVGLLKGLTSSSGQLLFRAVSKEEIVATKGLTGEENLVLGHIKSSGNEGIWTKHLKAKTSLHQTVIDRCLKTLTQKRLIKRVPSVQHITRKIYMLEGIEPSISLTGGPWYTDNELDTEFIQNLTEACYRLISDISFPKRRGKEGALYPISNAPQYPTADNIRHSLKKARLTETELSVEHVEMLLNILILDGKVEKIPSFGTALWNPEAIPDDGNESSDEERKSTKKKKRKKRSDDSSDDDSHSKKKRKKHVSSDSESEDSDRASSRKKSKKKRSKEPDDSDDESDAELKRSKSKSKSKNIKTKDLSSSDESSSEEEDQKPRKKGKKRKKTVSADSESSSDSEIERRRKKSKSKSKSKSVKRSSSPAEMDLDTSGGGSVYRALKETDKTFAWSESPCGVCPTFAFCKEGGPVNPQECVYYGEWLSGGTLEKEETAE